MAVASGVPEQWRLCCKR